VNGHLLDLPGKIGEQLLIEVVDELVEIAASGCCRGMRLAGVG
jgi:hypothetical protein